MSWYAAHIVLYVKWKEPLKTGEQQRFPIWENIILVKAATEAEAFGKAEQRGRAEEGDCDDSFRWGGKPARWVFAGVRKLTLCEDETKRPGDGTEVTYLEMEVGSKAAVKKLVEGKATSVRICDRFVDVPETPQKNAALAS
jgi:hypothetical protein